MPQPAVVVELMRRIPAPIRPNPHNIEEAILTASQAGWTMEDLASAVLADNCKQAGHVVAAIRRLSEEVPPNTSAQHTTTLGPCQLECDQGWLPSRTQPGAVTPCLTCRPDTYKRVQARDSAKKRGAPLPEQAKLIQTGAQHRAATYPVATTD